MYKRIANPVIFLLMLLVFTLNNCLRPLPIGGAPTPPPESVPARMVLKTEGISLLWVKEMELNEKNRIKIELFDPGEQSVVFWSPGDQAITSVDAATGELVWETEAPSERYVMRLYREKFFVTYFDSPQFLEMAPIKNNQTLPDCSFGGEANLFVYDAYTGQEIWGYGYHGVDSGDLYFEGQSVYLTGSANHGASRSLAEIDIDTGEVISLKCNKWPDKTEVPAAPNNDGVLMSSYRIVYDERSLEWPGTSLFFIVKDHRINILDGITKDPVASIGFDGAILNPIVLNVISQNDILVIYLNDSNQLFGFEL